MSSSFFSSAYIQTTLTSIVISLIHFKQQSLGNLMCKTLPEINNEYPSKICRTLIPAISDILIVKTEEVLMQCINKMILPKVRWVRTARSGGSFGMVL